MSISKSNASRRLPIISFPTREKLAHADKVDQPAASLGQIPCRRVKFSSTGGNQHAVA
jgi:hypothetical protein